MASSYARKYALCGIFAIDGERDPDQTSPDEGSKELRSRVRSSPTAGAAARAIGSPTPHSTRAFIANPGCCPAPAWEIE